MYHYQFNFWVYVCVFIKRGSVCCCIVQLKGNQLNYNNGTGAEEEMKVDNSNRYMLYSFKEYTLADCPTLPFVLESNFEIREWKIWFLQSRWIDEIQYQHFIAWNLNLFKQNKKKPSFIIYDNLSGEKLFRFLLINLVRQYFTIFQIT